MRHASVTPPTPSQHETWAPTICGACGSLVDFPYWSKHVDWHKLRYKEAVQPEATIRLVFPGTESRHRAAGTVRNA
jgi:hypothetical protein